MSAEEWQRPLMDDSPFTEADIGSLFGVWCVVAEPGEWWPEAGVKSWRSNVTGAIESIGRGRNMTRPEDLPEVWENSSALARGLSDCARELRDALRWIPVTERLPEKSGAYLVWQEDGECQRYALVVDFWLSPTRHMWSQPNVDATMTVTHWRELPAPPTEGT